MPSNLFSSRNIKIFLSSFISVFVMVTVQYLVISFSDLASQPCLRVLGFNITRCNVGLVSPAPLQDLALEILLPKLENHKNNYKLNRQAQFGSKAFAATDYEQTKSYIVVDYNTGDILAEKNSHKTYPMASLTKVMTAVVALDLAKPEEIFTVSAKAPTTVPTRLALTAGEKFTLEELLNAALLTSANDCVEVIREGINQKYQSEVFISAMNAKAKFIGLKNTSFANPQGFDGDEHFSSAEDLAILSHYALTNYPLIAELARKQSAELAASPSHTYSWLNNWNGLLGVYPGAFGLKTGNTGNAGNTTIVAAERQGKRVLVVVLGAPGVLERDLWASQLLDTGFQSLADLPAVNVTEEQLKAKYQTWKYFN